ncbi:MAG: serine hydrolase domain-containing protein, partial [Hyphomonadaceae bacterium]
MRIGFSMRRRDFVAASAALPFLLDGARVQEALPTIDTLAARAMAAGRMPGLGLAVTRGGETLLAKGYGRASLAFDAPVNERTRFQIGSLAKAFTATGVLMLVEAGRVDLNQPIGDYVRDLPEAWRAPSVRRVLTHTSGLPAYDLDDDFWDRPLPRAELIRRAGAALYFEPGRSFLYSNTGYCVLGWLIEDVSGQGYSDFIRERIIAPLGMEDARGDDAEAVIEGRAEPSLYDNGWRHAVRMSRDVSATGDGGILCSARDYTRWLLEMRAPTLLSPGAAANLREPATLTSGRGYPYSMGWDVESVRGRMFWAHSGSVPGVTSFARHDGETGVFLSTNCEAPGMTGRLRALAGEIVEALAPQTTEFSLPPMRDRAPHLTQRARDVLTRGEAPIDRAWLAEDLLPLLDTPQPEEAAPSFEGVAGLALVEDGR